MWTSEFFTKTHYKKHPLKYWAHVIGFEGEKSLLSAIKHFGWAESLTAGYEDVMDNSSIFSIELELTEKGLTEYI